MNTKTVESLHFSGPYILGCLLYNFSLEIVRKKWTNIGEKKYSLRNITNNDLKVPEKPKLKCLGFTYSGAKLFNMLPLQMRETKNPNAFKTMLED